MCLKTLDEPTRRRRIGYKAIYTRGDKLLPIYYSRRTKFKLNEWVIDKKRTRIGLWGNSREKYDCGFHTFTCVKDALEWGSMHSWGTDFSIIKVRLAGVVASGTDPSYNRNVTVAKKLMPVEVLYN